MFSVGYFENPSIKVKLLMDWKAFLANKKINHGFQLRPVIADETNPEWGAQWTARIFGSGEYFLGGKFVLKITLDPRFPEVPPTLCFDLPYPFHPNVSQKSGGLCYEVLTNWGKFKGTTIPALTAMISTFVATPDFPHGFGEDPKRYYDQGKPLYVAKLKELGQLKS